MSAIISRRDAQAQGVKRFFTGTPCKRGHIAERFTSNGGCVRCMIFSTPNRTLGAKGTNVGWPAVGLVFTTPNVQHEEMEAAFRMIEANGWHDHCIVEMRKDPSLLDKFRTKLTPQEVGILEAQLERARRTVSAKPLADMLLTMACGFTQMEYGPLLAVGDLHECNACSKQEVVAKVETTHVGALASKPVKHDTE